MIKKFEDFSHERKPIDKEKQTGKEHSLDFDDIDSEFAKYLRQNYYNVKLSKYDVFQIKKSFINH